MTRRELLAAALSAPALWAKRHFDRSRISAITDEIGKTPDESIAFAKQYGLQWIELRNVPGGKEYIYLDEPVAEGRRGVVPGERTQGVVPELIR